MGLALNNNFRLDQQFDPEKDMTDAEFAKLKIYVGNMFPSTSAPATLFRMLERERDKRKS